MPFSLPYMSQPRINPKLAVNQPGDSYELEAGAMADRVMQAQGSGIHPSVATAAGAIGKYLQRKCATCEEADKKKTRRKENSANAGAPSLSCSFVSALQSVAGTGKSMAAPEKTAMEQAFDADFSGVRLHTGDQASNRNAAINARAFTHNTDIFFSRGAYSNSSEGRHLLAHELTHVVHCTMPADCCLL